ncbi:MAG: hypothetical protein HY525_07115 [Betaproteobacteria bacterium]|nr:hypothetical protein [Betaproteobacteria bacterium]
MKKTSMLLSAIAVAACMGVDLPAYADPPPWAPAHGYRAKQYSYVYYPVREIYYAPESRMWFWMNGGAWQFGASLPVEYRQYTGSGGVSIVLESDRPYVYHEHVVAHHGKPKKRNKHDNH